MKYYIKQKVFSFTSQFDIYDEHQHPAYKVSGHFMSLSNQLELLNSRGEMILQASKKIFTFLPLYTIYSSHGEPLATMKKLFSLHPNFVINFNRNEYQVSGDFFAHSYEISDGRNTVAYISKKYLTWGDTYEIDILDTDNLEVWLFTVIVIDQVLFQNKGGGATFNSNN